jgi:hypothetical protein
MAGDKINAQIAKILSETADFSLTRPIKLISSVQTRALETLYGIRLQLDNSLEFEPTIIQEKALIEITSVLFV